jgi:hypothetical protein
MSATNHVIAYVDDDCLLRQRGRAERPPAAVAE